MAVSDRVSLRVFVGMIVIVPDNIWIRVTLRQFNHQYRTIKQALNTLLKVNRNCDKTYKQNLEINCSCCRFIILESFTLYGSL